MTTDAATLTDQFTCPDCGTEYRSWATYSRTDACRKARQAERFDGPDLALDADEAPAVSSKHYGNANIEAQDFEPGQGGAQAAATGRGSVFATEKQIAYLVRLATERGLNDFEQRGIDLSTTLKRDVSDWIDQMLAMAKPAAAQATTTTRRPNRYAGACVNCGAHVPAEGGWLTKDAAGKWAVEHTTCLATLETTPVVPAYGPSKGDVHVVAGEYFRIHESQGTGRHYAAHFDGHRFEYARGAIAKCTAENLCTAEQAAAFGHLHHQCVFCAR